MALLEAIRARDTARVRELIAVGADLRATDEDGCFTAMGLAAYLGCTEESGAVPYEPAYLIELAHRNRVENRRIRLTKTGPS